MRPHGPHYTIRCASNAHRALPLPAAVSLATSHHIIEASIDVSKFGAERANRKPKQSGVEEDWNADRQVQSSLITND
jgi:hypothetical protein